MAATAVVEYEWKGYEPPDDLTAWDQMVEARITHAAGIIISTGWKLLSDLRQELEEAGLTREGVCTADRRSGAGSRWLPRWREVWKREEETMSELSPRAQKARQESAGRQARQWRQANAARARAMKPHEARIARLAANAEKKYPELNGRATNAAELVRHGHVQHNGGARFSVHSQHGSEIHLVNTERRTCTCDDFKGTYPNNKPPVINGAPMCKHRAACLMYLKLQAPDPARIHAEEKRIAALQAGAILI
jgi:hypothetical protein